MIINTTNILVNVIGYPIAMAEMLAEYAKAAILPYQQEIQRDFSFRRFRVTSIGKPENNKNIEAKDNFAIIISIEVVYDDGWIIKRDDLKLKTVSRVVFDALSNKPLTM